MKNIVKKHQSKMFVFIHTKKNREKFPNIQRDAFEGEKCVWREVTGNLFIVFHTWQSFIRSLLEFICIFVALKKGHRLKTKKIHHFSFEWTVFLVSQFRLLCPVHCSVCVLRCSPFIVLAVIVIKINVSLLFCCCCCWCWCMRSYWLMWIQTHTP